ncbi:MAG: keto-deoxy-phosphogluconate aldolase, partial [Angustibacter sp.]
MATSPVVPVVVIEDVADAVPLASALLRGGVGVIEITLRTAAG